MIWRVNREAVVTLGGTAAILMQFAHPKVAAGVRDHSRFASDPAGRLLRTLEITMAWVFGTRGEAMQAARLVNRRHDTVVGADYSARDPELLMWVHATLVYCAIRAYRNFVGPLSVGEADRYYQDTKEIGVLLGIPGASYPDHVDEFNSYLEAMVQRGEVAVTADAHEMGWTVLQPRFRGVPRMALTPLRSITAGLLPPLLREQYGLRWGRRQRATFKLCRLLMPRLVAVSPRVLRFLPAARQAYQRISRTGDGRHVRVPGQSSV